MRINVLIINTELWALQLRLKYEYKFFDKFILVESRRTFSGISKPLYSKFYRNIIEDPEKKITYVYLDTLPWEPDREYLSRDGIRVKGNRWPAEVASRNAAIQPLVKLVEDPTDLIVVQDVDEIANTEAILMAEQELGLFGLHHLSYVDYRGSVSANDRRKESWTGGYVMRASMLGQDLHDMRRVGRRHDGELVYWHVAGPQICSNLDGSPMYPQLSLPKYMQYVRHSKSESYPLGWHLTNMTGGYESLQANKIGSYAHAENDSSKRLNALEDEVETGDLHAETLEYMNQREYSKFLPDPELPEWIKNLLGEFPILMHPNN